MIEFSSGIFNNTGDTLRLLDQDETQKDSMTYQESGSGYSWSRVSFTTYDWCKTATSRSSARGECLQEESTAVVILTPTKAPSAALSASSQKDKTNIPSIVPKKSTQTVVQKKSNQTVQTPISDDDQGGSGEQELATKLKSAVSTKTQTSNILPSLMFASGGFSLLSFFSLVIRLRFGML